MIKHELFIFINKNMSQRYKQYRHAIFLIESDMEPGKESFGEYSLSREFTTWSGEKECEMIKEKIGYIAMMRAVEKMLNTMIDSAGYLWRSHSIQINDEPPQIIFYDSGEFPHADNPILNYIKDETLLQI